MVQLSTRPPLGPLGRLLSVVVGLGAVAAGVALVRGADSAFGVTWASLFVVLGFIVLVSVAASLGTSRRPAPAVRHVTWAGEPARFQPRRTDAARLVALGVLALLGGWFAVMGLVGAIQENWVWPVLAVVPAVYFLGFPVLAGLGRFRTGGMWLSSTRVVDEHSGVRAELALAEVATVTPRTQAVHLTPVSGARITHRRLTPRPWRARPHPEDLVIRTDGLSDDGVALAAELREAVRCARG